VTRDDGQGLGPRPDIGCGFGDTTQRIAGLVGPEGEAVGVDAAARFIETARAEAEAGGLPNARFLVADVQSERFEGRFDLAFSRMGTMFFLSPVAAFRNVRAALDWVYRAQTSDIPILIGHDLEEAIAFVTAIGPAGELLRLAGDRAAHLHGKVHDALREGLSEFETEDGVRAPASTWIVTASAPG
jgi:SAM-dependent methyltransferase